MANIGDTIQDGGVVWTVKSNNTALHQNETFFGDLDDLTTRGYCYYSVNCTNKPDNIGGNLLILGDIRDTNYVVDQVAFARNKNIYHRTKLIGGWKDWQRLTSASEIVSAYSMGANGYVKFGSLLGGLIVQWGEWGLPSNENDIDIVFPISFQKKSSVVTTINSAGTTNSTVSVNPYLSGFSVHTVNNGLSGWYHAIGY